MVIKRPTQLLTLVVATIVLFPWLIAGQVAPALIQPAYLQLGSEFVTGAMAVVWHSGPAASGAQAEWRPAGSSDWRPASSQACEPLPDRDVCTAQLAVGASGTPFDYRVRLRDEVLSSGRGRAPSASNQPSRFVVFGDFGDGSAAQWDLARRVSELHRATAFDFGLIAGDLAYECGTRLEFTRNFFPILNPPSDDALMRSLPFAAAVGNHDVGDLRWPLPPFRCSSDYSFFSFLRHPRGLGVTPIGPRHKPKTPSNGVPAGSTTAALLGQANYSFAWGLAHVTVLDSNRYVDWSHASAQRWLADTLSAGQAYPWRFVLLHHPPFNLTSDHRDDQWIRYLVPMFERQRVTAVFSGHVHNFQWFGPVHFTPEPSDVRRYEDGSRGRFAGRLEVQDNYDGVTSTHARWPIYIVTGAGGGGSLIRGSRSGGCPPNVTTVQGCGPLASIEGRTPSLTVVEVAPASVILRQVASSGGTVLLRRIDKMPE